jgi:hypothetical protein
MRPIKKEQKLTPFSLKFITGPGQNGCPVFYMAAYRFPKVLFT